MDFAGPKVVATRRFIDGFAVRKPTVVIYPVPEVGWTPGRVNLIAIARGGPHDISTSWARYKGRNGAAIAILESIGRVRRVRPEQTFCNTFVTNHCAVRVGGTLYYLDEDHLSMTGARLIVRELLDTAAIGKVAASRISNITSGGHRGGLSPLARLAEASPI